MYMYRAVRTCMDLYKNAWGDGDILCILLIRSVVLCLFYVPHFAPNTITNSAYIAL